jgi:DNA repair exonuclease SbcCD nuclease subunit
VIRIVAFSDPHWDRSTLGVPRFDDLADAADQAVDYAVEKKANLLVCLGDVGNPDSIRTHRAAAKAVEVAKRAEAAKVASLWFTGNHDVSEDGSGSSTLEALWESRNHMISVYRQPGVRHFLQMNAAGEWEDLDIVVLPFVARSHAYDPAEFVHRAAKSLSARSKRVLVLGHLNLEGIGPGSETKDMPRGRDVFWPLDAVAEAFAGRDVFMMGGHYHEKQVYRGVHVVGSVGRMTTGEEHIEPAFTVLEVG